MAEPRRVTPLVGGVATPPGATPTRLELESHGLRRETRLMTATTTVVLLVIAASGELTVLVMPNEPPRRRPPDLVLAGDATVPTRVRVAPKLKPVTDGRVTGVEPGFPTPLERVGPLRPPCRVRAQTPLPPNAAAIKRVRLAMPREVATSVNPHRVIGPRHPHRRMEVAPPTSIP